MSRRPARTLLDRLKFAAIGALLGVIVGVPLGYLLGGGPYMGPWFSVPVLAGAGAVIGFLFLDGVGDFLGLLIDGAYQMSVYGNDGEFELPRWLAVLLVVALLVGVWWYFR
jgi:hypothetical protein